MEQKFTPNKWVFSHRLIPNDKDGMYATQVHTEDGETIATLSWYPMPKEKVILDGKPMISTGTYRDGNARLIASAPELLKACQSLIEVFETDYMLNGEIVDNTSDLLITNYVIAKEAVKSAIG